MKNPCRRFQPRTEFQQGIDDIRGKRRAAGSTAAGQQLSQAAVLAQEEQQAEQQLQEAAMLYARCLQHLLKVSCCAVHHACLPFTVFSCSNQC